MNNTQKKQIRIVKKQIKTMLKDLQKDIDNKINSAFKCGAVPEEYFNELANDSHLLAKSIIDSLMRDRPFSPLAPQTKKEFENIHISI